MTRCPRRSCQPLFFEEIGSLLYGLLGITAKAQVAQPTATADQLLVKPSRADDAGLPFDRKVRFQLHGYVAQPLRVVLAATLGQVVRYLP